MSKIIGNTTATPNPIGNLSNLKTKNKNSLVDAINEAAESGGSSGGAKEIHTGTDEPIGDFELWIDTDDDNIVEIPELKGADGDSAYEIACKNGFEGTEQEWLATLNGNDGHTPVKGEDYWTEADKTEVQTFINTSVARLDNVLQDILTAIQNGTSSSNTIAEIEQIIVSYLETKTAGEVEI